MMIVKNPTSRWSTEERTRVALRWDGVMPNNEGIVYGLWLVRQLSCAPNQQVAAADVAREWNEMLRADPRKAERCRDYGIDDGWWALSYWVSHAEQLHIEQVPR